MDNGRLEDLGPGPVADPACEQDADKSGFAVGERAPVGDRNAWGWVSFGDYDPRPSSQVAVSGTAAGVTTRKIVGTDSR